MDYLKFVQFQRKALKELNKVFYPISRNYLDILFFIYENEHSTISDLSKNLLFTNYNQTYQTVISMKGHDLIYIHDYPIRKGKPKFIFLTPKANDIILEVLKATI